MEFLFQKFNIFSKIQYFFKNSEFSIAIEIRCCFIRSNENSRFFFLHAILTKLNPSQVQKFTFKIKAFAQNGQRRIIPSTWPLNSQNLQIYLTVRTKFYCEYQS